MSEADMKQQMILFGILFLCITGNVTTVLAEPPNSVSDNKQTDSYSKAMEMHWDFNESKPVKKTQTKTKESLPIQSTQVSEKNDQTTHKTRHRFLWITWLAYFLTAVSCFCIGILISIYYFRKQIAQKDQDYQALTTQFEKQKSTIRSYQDYNSKLKKQLATLDYQQSNIADQLHHSLRKVDSANRQLMDGIQYAQMILGAFMPDMKRVKTFLPKSFFLWLPRDIIGGDIYFIHEFKEYIIISVLDCTGHGIPGAFMAIMAVSQLKQIVVHENCFKPSDILMHLNRNIKSFLFQNTTHSANNDGLDAAIISINLKTRQLTFAGAKLPFIMVSNGQITTIKGDKQSIGYKQSNTGYHFQNHKIDISDDITFYLATDGFSEQLGGDKNLRFGSKRFQDLLLAISQYEFDKQSTLLIDAFDSYIGNNERQDDVTVIGFKIPMSRFHVKHKPFRRIDY